MNGRGALFMIATATLSACATARLEAPAPEQIKIIDAHLHTEFKGGLQEVSGVTMTREGLLAEMKSNHVVGAVAHVGQDLQNWENLISENIIHCAGAGYKIEYAKIEAGLKDRRYRCIKIYLGYVHRWAYAPEYKRLYRLAEKYDVPVVLHSGDTYDVDGKLKYADPLTIDEVAVEFRKVNFVIAHVGNPWIESAAEVAYKNANVFLDASALLIGDLSQQPPEKVTEYVTKPLAWVFGYVEDPTKLMFGTDWPLNKMAGYIAACKAAIPREHWQAFFHDNAARVFHLSF